MLKQRLEQKQLQKLSPQQIMLMKLIQVPVASLEQRIKEEIMENPALEDPDDAERNEEETDNQEDVINEESTEDEFDLSDYYDEDDYDIPNQKLKINNNSPDNDYKEIPQAAAITFNDSLLSQLGLYHINDTEYIIAQHIIGNLENSGYLERELTSISDDLAFTQALTVTEEEIENVLVNIIHKLDPPGIGARDLQECLLIQLKRHDFVESSSIKLAINIIKDYFPEFTKKHYDKIVAKINCTEAELKEALDEILKLNPKPGGMGDGSRQNQYIIPDFTIHASGDKLEVTLNSKNLPELKLKRSFIEMLNTVNEEHQKEAVQFIKQKMDSAKWFIEAIQQRYNTLENTMNAIAEFQKEYFLTGDETTLKPMILKDIAEIVNLDISTVSRVANSKYVQTNFGTFLLKTFFSESLTNDSGEEVSSREIKKILSDEVDAENKRKPLTDEQICKVLKEKGYNIARRTVAKYREQLNIPVARLRKEL
ncbi:MAG: RNA polymerase factor sigma-54 [Bacteroidales bacterium]|nr:RNA polymerase factor sigma-54 [Bacteroidales bacterium]